MSAHPVNWISPLKMRVTFRPDETIVYCNGRLTSEVTADFKAEIKKLIPHSKCLVLDLGSVSYMDSAGLGTLVGLYVSAKSAKCHLQLLNLSKRIYQLLQISNVLGIFESCAQYMTKIP